MNRRNVVFASLGIGCAPISAWTQQIGKVWRIGVLLHNIRWENSFDSWVKNPLKELGYEEGRNLQFELRSSQGQQSRLDGLAAELVAAKVDLILAPLNDEIQAARKATSTIPVVMMYGTAPVEVGLIASLARPGGNVTGTTTNAPELSGKMIEVVRDAVPRLRRLTSLADADYPGMALYGVQMERAAAALGIKVVFRNVRSVEDLDMALQEIERNRPDAISVGMTGAILANVRRVIEFAASRRVPAIYSIKSPVLYGGLMSYSADFGVMVKRNAWMIDRIFKGAKPADIPVEEPRQFELVINLKTAKALGLTIPQALLLRADEVIQ